MSDRKAVVKNADMSGQCRPQRCFCAAVGSTGVRAGRRRVLFRSGSNPGCKLLLLLSRVWQALAFGLGL